MLSQNEAFLFCINFIKEDFCHAAAPSLLLLMRRRQLPIGTKPCMLFLYRCKIKRVSYGPDSTARHSLSILRQNRSRRLARGIIFLTSTLLTWGIAITRICDSAQHTRALWFYFLSLCWEWRAACSVPNPIVDALKTHWGEGIFHN